MNTGEKHLSLLVFSVSLQSSVIDISHKFLLLLLNNCYYFFSPFFSSLSAVLSVSLFILSANFS